MKRIFFWPSLYSFVLMYVEIQALALRHCQKTCRKYCTRSHSHELEDMENDHFFPWQTKHSSGEQRARECLCFSPRKFRIFCQDFRSGCPSVCQRRAGQSFNHSGAGSQRGFAPGELPEFGQEFSSALCWVPRGGGFRGSAVPCAEFPWAGPGWDGLGCALWPPAIQTAANVPGLHSGLRAASGWYLYTLNPRSLAFTKGYGMWSRFIPKIKWTRGRGYWR